MPEVARLRKILKLDLGCSVPTKLVRVWCHFNVFWNPLHSLSWKILKIPEFNLSWFWRTLQICIVPWHLCIFWPLMVKGRWKCIIRCKWNECHERSDSIWSKSKDFLGEILKIKLPLKIIPAVAPQISPVPISIWIGRSFWLFYDHFANFLVVMSRLNSKKVCFILKLKLSFFRKITKMITRVNSWIFTNSPRVYMFF